MARPSNPRGKDKPRSICLDGDVAEIAQRLADRSTLSSTLSELLRQNYGFGDAIEEKKRQMHVIQDEQQRLKQKEREIEAEIDAMELQLIERQTTIKPQLEKRIQLMTARKNNAMRDMNNAIDSTTRNNKHRVIQNLERMIAEAEEELEALL
jgi:DNA repair exonuclease SbcCD ATPase subunit